MSRPSLPPLSADDAVAAARDSGIAEMLAGPNVFRVLLRHPPIAKIIADMVTGLVLESVLDARLRELAIVRTGWLRGSVYEWTSHYAICARLGITDDEVVAVRGGPDAPGLPDDLRVVLRVVDAIVAGERCDDALLTQARAVAGSDEAYVELLAIPGLYFGLAAVLDALQVPLDGDRPEAWPPDGQVP
ncbi:MAG: carboxymuconolactone decarboxylase family protein [Acidimicrobiia bacterium]